MWSLVLVLAVGAAAPNDSTSASRVHRCTVLARGRPRSPR